MPNGFRGLVLQLTAAAILAFPNSYAYERVVRTTPPPAEDADQSREMLYLPDGRLLDFASFGYQNVVADFLWFKTINYFGKHHGKGEGSLRWLYHMCDLVTTLDPGARHVYEFGATMLSWEFQSYEQAVKLLTKATEVFEDDWHFFYLRGFTKMFFLKDTVGAKADFVKAATLPEVHPVVVSLASKKVTQLDDPQNAVDVLENLLRSSKDPNVREVLEKRLQEALAKRDMLRGGAGLESIPEPLNPLMDAG
jgi:hypothetical protein